MMERTREALADAVRPFATGGSLLGKHMPAFRALADALDLPPDVAPAPAETPTSDRYGPEGFLAPAAFIGGFIDAHEGGLSMDPADNGNWTGAKRGQGTLVGSKFGVTPGAVAVYRGVPASSITRADIAALTRDEAVAIGVKNYFEKPGFGKLPMNRVTLSAMDMGWGAGPKRGIQLLQRMIGVADDGAIGPATVAAYAAYIAQHGEEAAARAYGARRNAFYESLNQPRFLKGWKNRTASFLPDTKWWREAKR